MRPALNANGVESPAEPPRAERAVNGGILSEEVAGDLSADIDRALSELPAGEGKE